VKSWYRCHFFCVHPMQAKGESDETDCPIIEWDRWPWILLGAEMGDSRRVWTRNNHSRENSYKTGVNHGMKVEISLFIECSHFDWTSLCQVIHNRKGNPTQAFQQKIKEQSQQISCSGMWIHQIA
jgi:hypothetical protein